MSHRIRSQSWAADTASLLGACPSWCVAPHGLHQGEEDWVHTSEPLALTDRILARLCMTVTPDGELVDGPFVLIGGTEFTPEQANNVGLVLQALAGAAEGTTRRAAF